MSQDLPQDVADGSTIIPVADVTLFNVGDIIQISDANGAEIKIVVNITSEGTSGPQLLEQHVVTRAALHMADTAVPGNLIVDSPLESNYLVNRSASVTIVLTSSTTSPGTTSSTSVPSPDEGKGHGSTYAYHKGAFPWHYWHASKGRARKPHGNRRWGWHGKQHFSYSLTQEGLERKTVNQERRVLRSMLASEGCFFLSCLSDIFNKAAETVSDFVAKTADTVASKVTTLAEKAAAWAEGAVNDAVKWGTQAVADLVDWSEEAARQATTFWEVSNVVLEEALDHFAQVGAAFAMEAAEAAGEFFMSAFNTGKEVIGTFLEKHLANILDEANVQPRPTFCGGVVFPDEALSVVSNPNNDCWKKVTDMTEEIADFFVDDVGRLLDAIATRVSNMLEDEDLWKALLGKLGLTLIESLASLVLPISRSVNVYKDILAVMVTYLNTHLLPLYADLSAFFADVGRFLAALSERTSSLINSVFNEAGPFNFNGFEGKTWYISLCTETFFLGFTLGSCIYYPFKYGATDNDYFVIEVGFGVEKDLGTRSLSTELGVEGGIQIGPIMTNDKSDLEGQSFSVGLDIDFQTRNPKTPNINVGPSMTYGISPVKLLTLDFFAGINFALDLLDTPDGGVSFSFWSTKQYAWKLPGLREILGPVLGNLFETGPTAKKEYNYNAGAGGLVQLADGLLSRGNRTSKKRTSMDQSLFIGEGKGGAGGAIIDGVTSTVSSVVNVGEVGLIQAVDKVAPDFTQPTPPLVATPPSPGPPPPPPIPEPAQVDDVWLRGFLIATGSPLEGPMELPAKRRWVYVAGADCAVGTAVTTEAECNEASLYLEAAPHRGNDLDVEVGAWKDIPLGCSIKGSADTPRNYQKVHWNTDARTNSARATTDEFRAICRRPFYVAQQSQRDCMGGARILRKDTCVDAYMQLQSSFKKILPPRSMPLPQMNPSDKRIPPACSVEWDVTDKRQLFFASDFSKTFSPTAGQDYARPVCKKQQYWLERPGATSCPRGSQITSKEECENAYQNLKDRLPRLRARDRTIQGYWNALLAGCAVQYKGDMTPHFNTNPAPTNMLRDGLGFYVPMCKQPSWWLGENGGRCPMGTEITTFLECKMAHRALRHEYPTNPKKSFVVTDVTHIPRGCSVPKDHKEPHGPDAHFNVAKGDNVHKGWYPICKPARYVLGRRTVRRCPEGAEIRTAEECLRAHNTLKKEIKKAYGGWRSKGLISLYAPGNEIPPFCSSGGGPDTSPYFNINAISLGSGADSGKYKVVCKVAVTGQEAPATPIIELGPIRATYHMLNADGYTCEPKSLTFDPSFRQPDTLKLALVCCNGARAIAIKSGATCSPVGLTWELARQACEDRGERLCSSNEVTWGGIWNSL